MVYSYKCPESELPRWRYVLSEYFLFSLYVHFTHRNQTNHPLSNTRQGCFFSHSFHFITLIQQFRLPTT